MKFSPFIDKRTLKLHYDVDSVDTASSWAMSASRRQFALLAGAISAGFLTLAMTSAPRVNRTIAAASVVDKGDQMQFVTSADGTRIAYQRAGSGPPLVLVHGSADDHTRWTQLMPVFAETFTVYAFDRRGRGASGKPDVESYSLEREFEDVVAMVDAAGEHVNLLGHSFGALCALEAALRTDRLNKLVLYEPPMLMPPGQSFVSPDTIATMERLLAAGDREGVLLTFAREIAQVPEEMIAMFRSMPEWQAAVDSADTLVYEVHAVSDYVFDPERFHDLMTPTLLLLGSESPSYAQVATGAVASALPNVQLVRFTGEGHLAMDTAPELFVSTVMQFLTG